MKVLVWNSWITPAGGMERVAMSIANGLAGRGCQVTLVGPYDKVPVLRSAISKEVEFVHCGFERTPAGLLRNALFLHRLVRQRQIDVVSAHGSLIPLLTLNVPVVWTEHGPRYGGGKILSGAKAFSWRMVQRRLRSNRWKFVGCSEYVRDRVCSELSLDASSAAVIYNGVPAAAALQQLPLPAFKPPYRVGFIGRLEPEKHPMDVFVLDEILAQRGIPCEWVVFGEGSLSRAMHERARENPRIQIRGLAPNAVTALAEVDVLAFLSHGQMEGLPTVMLEARLARRPVVAWNVTANPEAAGSSDVLVTKLFDLTAFADALEAVITRPPIPPEITHEISFERMIDQYEGVLYEASRCRVSEQASQLTVAR